MKKKPFHKVILNNMRELAKKVQSSTVAENQMICLGEIFREAILPKYKKSEIIKSLEDLAKNFPNKSNDTESAQYYLKALAKTINK